MDIAKRFASVESMDFRDHHYYSIDDVNDILQRMMELPEPHIIVTTEKDATRLMTMPDLSDEIARHIWILPIKTKIMQEKDKMFNDKITGYVQKNLRNRRMAQNQDDDTA